MLVEPSLFTNTHHGVRRAEEPNVPATNAESRLSESAFLGISCAYTLLEEYTRDFPGETAVREATDPSVAAFGIERSRERSNSTA